VITLKLAVRYENDSSHWSAFSRRSPVLHRRFAVYISHCIECHSPASASHAPSQEALAQIPWQDILKTLETGAMKIQAQNSRKRSALPPPATLAKAGGALLPQSLDSAPPPRVDRHQSQLNGWESTISIRAPARRGRRSHGESDSGLKLKWAFGFPGQERPTVSQT